MALLLNIETATDVCSVALGKDGKLLSEKINTSKQNHAKLLTILIEEIFNESKTKLSEIDGVAISQGPGSYTGLRIGTSVAKGICYALNIPLLTINTLAILTNQPNLPNADLYCPMIDARRMEVYCQLFDKQLNPKSEIEAKILDQSSFSSLLLENKILFLGNGSNKFEAICTNPNAHFIDNKVPLATNMISLAENAFSNQLFADVAYFTPFYLKKYQVTTSKKRLF